MNINKPELVTLLAEESGFTKQDSEIMLNTLSKVVREKLLELPVGGQIKITGLGIFEVVEAKEKKGRNPRNPEQVIIIPATKKIKFKPEAGLKKEMKQR